MKTLHKCLSKQQQQRTKTLAEHILTTVERKTLRTQLESNRVGKYASKNEREIEI